VKLRVFLPTEVFMEEEVKQVTAEGEDGCFCLKPRHIDFVSALVPGLLSYINPAGDEVFMAVGDGVLVKCGADVLVSTTQAAAGPDLGTLKDTVERRFRQVDDREKSSRTAMAKLEANFVRRFLELGEET